MGRRRQGQGEGRHGMEIQGSALGFTTSALVSRICAGQDSWAYRGHFATGSLLPLRDYVSLPK